MYVCIITLQAASRYGCTAHCPAQQALARRYAYRLMRPSAWSHGDRGLKSTKLAATAPAPAPYTNIVTAIATGCERRSP